MSRLAFFKNKADKYPAESIVLPTAYACSQAKIRNSNSKYGIWRVIKI